MKKDLKIVIISVITTLIILTLILAIPKISRSINVYQNDKYLSKYYGEYELIDGDITNISQIVDEINNKKIKIKINKDNISKTSEMDLAQDYFYVYKNNNHEILYAGVHMFADYADGHTDLDIQLCFILNKNNLNQVKCPTDNVLPHFNTDNVNLKFKKIN